MQLNGSPLNGAPLNGGLAVGAPPAPVTIDPVVSVLWSVRLMLNGVDSSHLLAGSISIQRRRALAALPTSTCSSWARR